LEDGTYKRALKCWKKVKIKRKDKKDKKHKEPKGGDADEPPQKKAKTEEAAAS